jgi:hypothetical protein
MSPLLLPPNPSTYPLFEAAAAAAFLMVPPLPPVLPMHPFDTAAAAKAADASIQCCCHRPSHKCIQFLTPSPLLPPKSSTHPLFEAATTVTSAPNALFQCS